MKRKKGPKRSKSGSSRRLRSKALKRSPKRKVKRPKKAKKILKASKKKKPVKKVSRAKPKSRRVSAKASAAPRAPVRGTLIGHVSHYFPHVHAAAIKIEYGSLQVGDRIYIKGHTTDFEQTVDSLQMNHAPVTTAKVGDDIGVSINDRVREHDAVYKL